MKTELLYIFTVGICVVKGANWGYEEPFELPSTWPEHYPDCGGSKQSPINIVTSEAQSRHLGNLMLSGFGTEGEAEITNNGHTLKLTPTTQMTISGGGLPAKSYKVLQLHFHWGVNDNTGSEHQIDGHPSPLEMHVVTLDTKYDTPSNIPDSLAVLGFLFEISSTDNAAMNSILDQIPEIPYKGDHVKLPVAISLESLLPDTMTGFYSYNGSLTTPDCWEIVGWTVFKNKIDISAAQLAKFRELHSSAEGDGDTMIHKNYRPVQDLGSRRVYQCDAKTMVTAAHGNGAAPLYAIMSSIITLAVATAIYCS